MAVEGGAISACAAPCPILTHARAAGTSRAGNRVGAARTTLTLELPVEAPPVAVPVIEFYLK